MGITNFNKLLKLNNIEFEKVKYSDFKNKTIAIDASILIYRIMNASIPLSHKGKVTTHIYGIFNKLYEMLMAKIKIIVVFDGVPPKIKKKRENFFEEIPDFIIHDIKLLLDLMSINYIQSIGEADTQCAYLFKHNIVDFVYSPDTDMLAFGCDIVVTLNKNNGSMIYLKKILKKLNLSHSQFIDVCNILGNDYFPGIKNIGPSKVLTLRNKIIKNEDMRKVKNYYLLKNIELIQTNPIIQRVPDYNNLSIYLIKKLGFNKQKTLSKIDKLHKIIY